MEKNVLITVLGMSPAVVTETIWALFREGEEQVPDEVCIVTSEKGRMGFKKGVLDTGIWGEMKAAVGKEGMRLEWWMLTDPSTGEALDDIVNSEHQEIVADKLLEIIRRYKNPQGDPYHIVASIAGGRKSMSALMYAAMSLAAEETDRITHVLVDDEVTRIRDFFYPGQKKQELSYMDRNDQQEKSLTAANVRCELADLPFVPLSFLVGSNKNLAEGSFNTLVEKAKVRCRDLDPRKIRIRLSRTSCEATINGKTVDDIPADAYALLCGLVLWRKTKSDRISPSDFPLVLKLLEDNLDSLPGVVREKIRKKRTAFYIALATVADKIDNSISKKMTELRRLLNENNMEEVSLDALENGKPGFRTISDVDFE
ncbi:MAG: CRISPR-associated ring nuclease Csm6 [Akkermansia muciniphila]|nr:CRISPR-associated ring nuclease Csm6 [Akkermansia muciniphila]